MTKRPKLGNQRRPQFHPCNQEQLEAYLACKENTVSFLTGIAGSSKTYTAIACAVDLLMERQIERICISRPAVEACGEKIGFIPGGISEKMHPFLVPIYDNLKSYAQENYEQVMEVTEIVPLAYMRGRTLRNACVILDEAQNASFEQMKMFLTRIGKGSHMIICGDESQSDIRLCVLTSIAERLSQAVPSIYHHRFQTTSAAIRHPIIPLITRSLESAPC